MGKAKRFINGLRRAWREENASALIYRAIGARERDLNRRSIFERIAAEEEKHARRWEERLRELGADPGPFSPTLAEKVRLQALLGSGNETVVRAMEAAEKRADGTYDSLAALAPSDADRVVLREAKREEGAHDLVLGEMAGAAQPPHPRRLLDGILGRESWHVRTGGWIGQAIYGINDGLGAAFGVVSGVAGATRVNSSFVLLSGFASMIASALSMGSGAYLATKAEKEVHEAELARERREIEEKPEEEQEELALFYQLKGFTPEESRAMAARMAKNPEEMLRTLAHEELGLSDQAFPSVWRSAVSATLSTAVGAAIPVVPYLFSSGMTALAASFVVSTLAHFGVGAAKVIVTGRSWWRSGMEMMLIGLGEAAITYGIGLLVAPMIG